MSFIGNRPDSFGYSSTSYDHFSGTGSQTVYTLTRSVSANADIFVTVNNVPQDPGVAYYVTDLNTLTFTSAPSAVANNIVVVYRNFVQTGLALGANTVTSFTIAPGAVQAYQISSVSNTSISGLITAAQLAPGAGGNPTANNLSNTAGNTIITSANSITMNAVSGIINASVTTGALIVPTGTTAQRPVNAANGAIRWNTSNNWAEIYTGTLNGWYPIAYGGQYSVTYLVVAGGAGGGGGTGDTVGAGGGGAGGLLTSTFNVTPGTAYTVSVGGGGAGGAGTSPGYPGSSGTNSSISGVATSIGGGGGHKAGGGAGGGVAGGSGGGATRYSVTGAGTGTAGQGNPGGTSVSPADGAGGGGGSGAAGSNATTSPTTGGGAGGIGSTSSINGTTTYYAGGGGGGGYGGIGGAGGLGGGANGAGSNAGGSSSPANTGGGAGGAALGPSSSTTASGGSGGSGIVILSYSNPSQRGTGGAVTSYVSGSLTYWVHTFTSSGTFTA